MKLHPFLILFALVFCENLFAQFPGAAGTIGSTAIYKDSSIFVAWANSCQVSRGYQDISDTTLGFANTGDPAFVSGPSDGVQVLSLGDGGFAIVGFEKPIVNGPGFDFAVFENGFIDEFLELAFVEVSSDGINFFRFKATSNTQSDVQIGPFDYNADPTLMNNLAGKYRALFGTPFDLEEMTGIQGLNVDSITHIKVIDVVGSINPLYASYDQNNHVINEHYPTPYPQGGFDLDAIGVIHQQVNAINEKELNSINIFPNPFVDDLYLEGSFDSISKIELLDQTGNLIYQCNLAPSNKINFSALKAGCYFLVMYTKQGTLKPLKVFKIKS
jgi:hypothetical protein